MRRFKGNLLSVGKPLKFETSSSKIHILKLSTQGVSSAIPISVPYTPTNVVASEPGNRQVRVTWTAPEKNGGSVITSYILTCSQGFTQPVSGSLTTTIFTGLTNGTSYTFTVQAINVAGASIASSPSNSVTPFSVPSAPTIVTTTLGNAQATLTWTPPSSNGGSTIIMYRVTSNNNIIKDVSGTLTTTIVSGLTNGTSYTFTVQAINVFGSSIPSSPSNSVTLVTSALAQATVILVTPNLDTTFPDTHCGSAIEISNDGNVICITNSFSSNSPYIKIYRFNASNASWNNEKTITTSYNESNGFPYEAPSEIRWGRMLAISGNGNYIGIGNANSSIFFSNGGLVEIYQYNVTTQLWSRDSWINSILVLKYNNTGPAPTIMGAKWGEGISFNYTGNVCAINSGANVNIYKQTNNVWMLTSVIYDVNITLAAARVSLSNNGNILVSSFETGAKAYIESSANTWSVFPYPSPEILFNHNSFVTNVKISQDGTTIIISVERFTGILNNQGAVMVYRFISNSWTQIGKTIFGSSTLSTLGSSLAISNTGNIIVIGAWRFNSTRGVVYGYGYNSTEDNWDLLFSILGENTTDRLGFFHTLDITSDATKLVLGVPYTGNGSVRIYNIAYDTSLIP